jgi:hypothetical protein
VEQQSLYVQTLHRAVVAVGGIDRLCARLELPVNTVAGWMAEVAPIPETAFLKLVDFLQEEELRDALKR